MRLAVTTPLSIIIEVNDVAHLRAEDETRLRECIPARLPLRIKIFTFLVWGSAIYGLVMFVTGIFGLR